MNFPNIRVDVGGDAGARLFGMEVDGEGGKSVETSIFKIV